MSTHSFFARILARLRRSEGGFSLIETVAALGVLFIALMALAHTAAVGFTDIALSRQRQQANQLVNKLLEQVRGLSYERVGQGLDTDLLGSDPTSIVTCPDGLMYYLTCDATGERIVHSQNPSADVPLVPHLRTFGPAEGYTTTFSTGVYVTTAKEVPITGAFRVTAVVSWDQDHRPGLPAKVSSQSLLYTPEGTTDATTGGGTAPFFYGTGSIGRAPITLTPNPGVVGGTGLQGLPPWDSMTVNLYGVESSLQEQSLIRAESKVILTGASQVVSGVETLAGGDASQAIADDDPATLPATTSAPGGLMQQTVTSSVGGGGNSIEIEATSGTEAQTCPTPQIKWLSGMESGTASSVFSELGSTGGSPTADSAVARTGTYSLRVAQAAGGTVTSKGQSVSPSANALVAHFAIRLASLPTADVASLAEIPGIGSPNTRLQLGYKASTNRFRLWFDGSNPVESTMTVTAGTWYTVDLYFNGGTSPDSASWQIDGAAQPATTAPAGVNTNAVSLSFGAWTAATAFTANYDDMAFSTTAADYPLPDLRVGRLLPNGNPWWQFSNGAILNDNNTSISSTSWQRLDDVPMTSTTDYIKQVSNDGTGYVELSFEDTAESCILGVRALAHLSKAGSSTTHGKTDIYEQSQVTTVNNGDHVVNTNAIYSAMVGTLGGASWSATKVNSLTARLGYSTDANPDPYWYSLQLGYAYVTLGSGTEGPAGVETGSSVATVAADAGTPCGSPAQLDGLPCTYATETYSIDGPPHLSARLGVTGSSIYMARIYRFTPSTQAGAASHVWGRRTPGTGGAGTVKESVVRYPGTHQFGKLAPFMGTGPPGWLGYWVKYDAGTSASSVTAEAGVGSAPPSFTSSGTISYWNGSGYSTMAPPAAGGAIPVAPVDYTASGYRVEISGSLATAPSFVSQIPSGASGTALRNEARALLGAPVSGTFQYKATWTASNEVIADVTVAVDLGTLSATARYATS